MRIAPRWSARALWMVVLVAFLAAVPAARAESASFHRVATFPAFLNSHIDEQSVSEIVAASEDGLTLIYTDSAGGQIGFVDITDPRAPLPGGALAMGGEPTSVAVAGRYALVAVDTSPSFAAPSGLLRVVDVAARTVVATHDLGGQPDSVAVSPDRRYAAIAIENERDEDAGDGRPPQSPPGFVVIVDLVGAPAAWTLRTVSLVGIASLFAEDPEPEFVSINDKNVAAVTLQENNHLVLIDLRKGEIIRHWSAGTVDLDRVDTAEDGIIALDGTLAGVLREPDAVVWTGNNMLATADEGDLDGGSRGFTIFNAQGKVPFRSGNLLEHLAVRVGHYAENRSENKGTEPEGIAYGQYGDTEYLFVGSERSSFVAVFRLLNGKSRPEYVQTLPTGMGPEGLLAIPHRNLFVTASEEDSREDGIRSVVTIYQLLDDEPTYPTVVSADRADGTPIPWGALSALAAHPTDPTIAYTGYDSFYRATRIFVMDVSRRPAVIREEIVLKDGGATVDLDLEGIAARASGGFWVASEGAGNFPAVTQRNQLFRVAPDGTILQTVELPDATNLLQRSNGFEGVASVEGDASELVYVAFQREWSGDPAGRVRIGRYEVATGAWTFFYYPLDPVESPLGGFVGLSELVALDAATFAVIERDNRAGADARIKRIYRFSVAGLTPAPEGGAFPLVTKTLVRDLMPDLETPRGAVIEKVEGLTVLANGDTLIVTDNDGVDGSNGETQLIRLGSVFGR